jgi:hypothetical protein
MVIYTHEDPNRIPYYGILNEVSQLTIVVCPMRINEPGYDGRFIPYITNKLKAFESVDRVLVDDFTEAIPLDSIEQLINSIETDCGIPRCNIVFVNGVKKLLPMLFRIQHFMISTMVA